MLPRQWSDKSQHSLQWVEREAQKGLSLNYWVVKVMAGEFDFKTGKIDVRVTVLDSLDRKHD